MPFGLSNAPSNDFFCFPTRKNQLFIWLEDQQRSFENLKIFLSTPPVLGHPKNSLPMEVHCDASGLGLGVLVQRL